ncbi:Anthranilate phosphoribosyltransferase [Caenispirillum salinarum AK4]|uniref:Anthranilate phosphoribosyltransferase n=1 Tax=Caenispirillum salinarum AK4 TaxID=1238182 RepID=K9HKB6_9PROT|nr:anthranilate phosphoribosyltransferase [Caenispirillum salinarum]EKV30803.1 Anthranilate phosphoribosyltransferase [Caenispirillum salinarum AK4]
MGGTTDVMKEVIATVATGATLNEADAERAFEVIMSGEATPSQIGAFLMALRVRGETVEEITGAARTMRAKAARIDAPADAVDTCGTGGDASGTYNISTCAAIVVAACGVPVAKHGNRAASSKSGSADVLAALGVNLDAPHEVVEQAIREAGIGFMMAPRHHSAMRHVMPTRTELGTRTLFNLLGPLSNPANARFQVLGVFAHNWIEPIAQVLGRLGTERAWVVHGSDGLDEITTTGATYVAELRDGKVSTFEVTPEEAGLARASMNDLKGGDAEVNAAAIRDVLAGRKSAYRDIVLMNAGAALVVAGKAATLRAGMEAAAQAVDSGKALETLNHMIRITNGEPSPQPETAGV